jgi:hypothetical protein
VSFDERHEAVIPLLWLCEVVRLPLSLPPFEELADVLVLSLLMPGGNDLADPRLPQEEGAIDGKPLPKFLDHLGLIFSL